MPFVWDKSISVVDNGRYGSYGVYWNVTLQQNSPDQVVDIKNGCGERTGAQDDHSAVLAVSTIVIGTWSWRRRSQWSIFVLLLSIKIEVENGSNVITLLWCQLKFNGVHSFHCFHQFVVDLYWPDLQNVTDLISMLLCCSNETVGKLQLWSPQLSAVCWNWRFSYPWEVSGLSYPRQQHNPILQTQRKHWFGI